jgi:hypothetical protein
MNALSCHIYVVLPLAALIAPNCRYGNSAEHFYEVLLPKHECPVTLINALQQPIIIADIIQLELQVCFQSTLQCTPDLRSECLTIEQVHLRFIAPLTRRCHQ